MNSKIKEFSIIIFDDYVFIDNNEYNILNDHTLYR